MCSICMYVRNIKYVVVHTYEKVWEQSQLHTHTSLVGNENLEIVVHSAVLVQVPGTLL